MRFLIMAVNLCRDPYPVYPLGMSVIASAVRSAGHEVKQFDLLSQGIERLGPLLREFDPEFIGISIRNLDTVNSRSSNKNLIQTPADVLKFIRKESNAPVILGGAGFSVLPEEVMKRIDAEYGIAGEGESAILTLLDGKEHPHGLYHSASKYQAAPLYDPEILDFYQKETHIIPIQTKRGCPFECAYCTYPGLEGHFIRERGTDSVLDQVEELHEKYPDSMFYFVDAVFNDPQKHFLILLDGMEKRKMRPPFAAFLSPFMLNEDEIIRMKECGMIAAELGVDAASDETLAGLQKNFTFAEAAESSALLLKHKIGVTTNVMFGGPEETWKTVEKGIRNLRSLEPAYTLIFSGIRVYPGTPLYQRALAENKIPAGWDPLEELYYFADGIDPEILHQKLLAGFSGSACCIYPPDAKNRELQTLHKFGYAKWRKLQ